MNSAIEIMDTGFACLVEKLGVVDAAAYAQNHPHNGKGIRI